MRMIHQSQLSPQREFELHMCISSCQNVQRAAPVPHRLHFILSFPCAPLRLKTQFLSHSEKNRENFRFPLAKAEEVWYSK